MSETFQSDIEALAGIPAVRAILDVVCHTTGMGFAAIARVTEDRWVACAVRDTISFGLAPGGELKVETTICHEIRDHREIVVIDHVAEDAAYSSHPTPALYKFQSYISMPIILPDGQMFGTLCAIDPAPARLNRPEIVAMFKLFAELLAFHIDAAQRLRASEASLIDARQTSELREQFIAVLGHDLRNPLASIEAGTRLLTRRVLDDRAKEIVGMMQASVTRMAKLIDNVLDFARGRLGSGLTLDRLPDAPILSVLAQVIDEERTSHPALDIETHFDLTQPITCDTARMGQLFSNLLGNAVTHGAAPIRVRATTERGVFTLSVANAGPPIPPADRERLFTPFSRRPEANDGAGLGLGLYIASEIARAHGGRIDVVSGADETRFTFRMTLG